MTTDISTLLIIALLPLAAGLVVLQKNPYHALVIRGILGAVAALVYAVLGGADVALTEALVGTMLAITLYAVAVRSSLVMRLGMISEGIDEKNPQFEALMDGLQQTLDKYHMRLDLVSYGDRTSLDRALIDKEIHATCIPSGEEKTAKPYHTTIRVERLYEIMQTELPNEVTSLSMPSLEKRS
nr:DUF4040 domain-containing protein [Roseofilum halophilum]